MTHHDVFFSSSSCFGIHLDVCSHVFFLLPSWNWWICSSSVFRNQPTTKQDLCCQFWTVFSFLLFFCFLFWLFSSTCSLRMIVASSSLFRLLCWLLFSYFCVCVFVNFFSFLSHRTFFYHNNSTPAGWTFVFSSSFSFSPSLSLFVCFHPYFSNAPHSLWISTRICCVEHVNDCTPFRR